MSNNIIQSLIKDFSPHWLAQFLRRQAPVFRPASENLDSFLQTGQFDRAQQLGNIELSDVETIIVAAVHVQGELTSRSSKKTQYEFSKRVIEAQPSAIGGIFAFYDDAGRFRLSLITLTYEGTRRRASDYRRYTFFVSPDEGNRTFIDRIGQADFSTLEGIREAFSVEPVTREFFRTYHAIFKKAEASIALDWSAEQKRLYTQKFFNRLMFIAFLERKGWLAFQGRKDYLRALFADYWQNDPEKRRDANFHRKRLNALFFMGLNYPGGDKRGDPAYQPILRLIGEVPYLNGGLFEKEADDETFFFPDEVVASILSDLLYAFNFTVAESTPLDVEVAVDPEMLGKMFEELVTGRHESGSYYTPKEIVSFMGREALRYHLAESLPGETSETLERFVYEQDASGLRRPESVLAALREVKICDPACGSGAYLLGMLHELLDLRSALFVARRLDADTVYERKLEIIQNNLYGVDMDAFAVNIARLRLWLSLIVDYEGDDPPPLPNLDFKIETGDALTAPDPTGGLQPDLFRYGQVKHYFELKSRYLESHGEEKADLRTEIEALKAEIRAWAHPVSQNSVQHDDGTNSPQPSSFDWQVEFAEVFAPRLATETLSGKMSGIVNMAGGQMELTAPPKEGGFDIILGNPPYVRQERLGDYKALLKPRYPEVYNGTADLYVYFYARAHQLLKPGGAACFISSNKWLRAGYGEKLRRFLLDQQAMRLVVDFGELPVFQSAATFPAIFLWQKKPRVGRNSSQVGRDLSRPDTAPPVDRNEFRPTTAGLPTRYVVVKDLAEAYQSGLRAYVEARAETLPAEQFGPGKPRLVSRRAAALREQMEKRGVPLGEYVDGEMYRGIVTGYNKAFLLGRAARDRLLEADPRSAEIIKPLLKGDDVRHYEIHDRERYIIFARRGIEIERYPAVLAHLAKFRRKLEPEPRDWDRPKQGKWPGRKPGAYTWYELQDTVDYYAAFEQPKIIYPEIAREPRFYLDTKKYFPIKTIFSIPEEDWFLLALLNSKPVWEYLKQVCSVLGDENQGGRLTLQAIYMETLPIPAAAEAERAALEALAQQAQGLHMRRRALVGDFLRAIGKPPARSNSRNPLEKPWLLTEEEFTRRGNAEFVSHYRTVRDQTAALTEEIEALEAEINARVAGLYNL